MRGQLAAEQFGIGTCDDNMHLLSQHTIDEQMPSHDILYLIEEKIRRKNVKRDILHKNIASETLTGTGTGTLTLTLTLTLTGTGTGTGRLRLSE